MRFVDEFRDPRAARDLSARIRRAADRAGRPLRFMEVCGGHTMAIHRFGIPELLPEGIELRSGPGGPVCVTPTSYLDRAIEIARTMLASDDQEVATAAEQFLDGVAGHADASVAGLAEAPLDFHAVGLADAARVALQGLGMKLVRGMLAAGQQGMHATFDTGWRGTSDDLRLLLRLPGLLSFPFYQGTILPKRRLGIHRPGQYRPRLKVQYPVVRPDNSSRNYRQEHNPNQARSHRSERQFEGRIFSARDRQ